jgi:GT2 family glycosyltransferase
MRASIVIPVFNKASLTAQCLEALFAHPPATPHEVIVVDDASSDSTGELLEGFGPRVRVVRHETNRGFATSCNDGAAAALGEFLVFLNNDTIPKPGWLDALVHYADEHQDAAVVGSKLLFPNDTIQHAGVVICQDRHPRHVYAGFPARHHAVNKSRQFQIVTAACCLIRREAFEAMHGFDVGYRNGYEDVDLCLRIGHAGLEVHYCHTSELYHLESISDGRFDALNANMRRYADQWMERVRPDDIDYYLADGLLRLDYSSSSYPLQVDIAPGLGSVRSNDDDLARLLGDRSRQVFELIRDNVLLTVRVREAELGDGSEPVKREAASSPLGRGPSGSPSPAAPARLVSRGRIQWLSSEPARLTVSVILPVKNGAAHLADLLPVLLRQQAACNLEIIAVDSGSADDSVDILIEHGATVVAIEPASFNHGLTRNLGATHAHGDVLVFLNQTALPADPMWLETLVAPLTIDSDVVGVCSRVQPRSEADPLTRLDGNRDPSGSGERQIRRIEDWDQYARSSESERRLLVNFHTVSAAIRPGVLQEIPFREVLMGEDILWAKEVLEAGYAIQHEPDSVVLHSHDYSFIEILQRNVDDALANRDVVGRALSIDDVEPLIRHLVDADMRYLAGESELREEDLQEWRVRSTMRRTAQAVGQWLGGNREAIPPDVGSILSLTESTKSGRALTTGGKETRGASVAHSAPTAT